LLSILWTDFPKYITYFLYAHIKFWWYRTMLNFCGIVAAILKMVIGRNLSMSGINSGHHYLPTYEMYHQNLIPDIEKFLPIAIFKMAATILQKFNIVRYHLNLWNVVEIGVEIGQCWICAVLWWPFWKWWQLEIFQCQESIGDIIINSTLFDFNEISYVGRLWWPEVISVIEKFQR
jgi:hypothetical protein